MLKKIVSLKLLIPCIVLFTTITGQSQKLNIVLNGVTELNLEGNPLTSGATDVTPITVTLTEDSILGPFTTKGNGLIFLNVYTPDNDSPFEMGNSALAYSKYLNMNNLKSSVVNGVGMITYTWEISLLPPRDGNNPSDGVSPTEAIDYRMYVRAFKNASGFDSTLPAQDSAILLDVVNNF